ncbi:glycosyltransferase [Corynebacterium pyruviciproducens]|uniref:glycosyltransferase family 2 protein n=1 Tax=Corynebacterium pyruviciproducens TaxID=598660 RepID=UPI0024555A02|nr:glycosyltransferase [Corynebacterium pyruviciproducens]MDH4658768.1 glycosyltransferase [Corynebacterium pyruviciproducens]
MVNVSAVIPVRDRDPERLYQSGRSLLNSRLNGSIELIVSDLGSENSKDLESVAHALGAKYIKTNLDHWNKPICLNRGIAEATGELILCADIDMVWHPDALQKGVARISGNSLQRVLAFQSRDLPSYFTDHILSSHGDIDFLELSDLAVLHSTWGNGILLFPRSLWEKVGGYDERLSVYGVEDVDFCRRLQFVGAKFVWSNPADTKIFHVWHPTVQSISRPDSFQRALNRNKNVWRYDFSVVRNATSLVGESVGGVPLVSVVIATSGRSELLETAICSILCQTVQDFEIIVVDDGCLDDTRGVVDAFLDPRIKYFGLSEQRGISYARNFGGKKASGQFVAVMDDDDIALPNRFEVSVAAITRGVDGCVGSFITFHNDDGKVYSWADPTPELQGAFAQGGFAGHPTWFVRREVFNSFAYDESFSSSVDNNMALRMLMSGVRMVHIGQPVVLRRVHDGQVTNKDGQFQGFGAKLDRTWMWSGYKRAQYDSLVKESKEKAPKNAPALYEAVYLPYLPDHLVRRTVDADVWSCDELDFVSSLPGISEIFTVRDSEGKFVFGKVRTAGTWKNMARLSQKSIKFVIVGFEETDELTARNYVPECREFSRSVPWKDVLKNSDETDFRLEVSRLVEGTWKIEGQTCKRDIDNQAIILNDQFRKRYHREMVGL